MKKELGLQEGRRGLICVGETEGMRTRDGQQQRLLMSHTQGKDTNKALLNMDIYIYIRIGVARSQTRCSRGEIGK